MVEEKTASNIMIFGMILQLLMLIIFPWFYSTVPILINELPPGFFMVWTPLLPWLWLITLVFWLVGLFLLILWYRWFRTPSEHKWLIIITAIIGILLSGVLPGIIVLIAGILAPKK